MYVDLERLLVTPKAVENLQSHRGNTVRSSPPSQGAKNQDRTCRVLSDVLEYERVPKVIVISFSVVAIIVVLRQTRLIPNAVASFVVIRLASRRACLVYGGFES